MFKRVKSNDEIHLKIMIFESSIEPHLSATKF